MMEAQIKNFRLLNEANRNHDFFNFAEQASNLSKVLRKSTTPAVIAIVGRYGSGKSVLINETKKTTNAYKAFSEAKWVIFECWQYPDKRDLWEAFLLELVEDIDGSSKRRSMERAFSDVTGWRGRVEKYLADIKTAAATILGITTIFYIAWASNNEVKGLLISLISAALLVAFASIELLIKPQSLSKVSRLSDYKSQLEHTLKDHPHPLFIVLEDVDRADELGRKFLETVSHFFRSDIFADKKIYTIVPVSDFSNGRAQALQDTIEKSSDNILYFEPSYSCSAFLSEIFTSEFLDDATLKMLTTTIDPLIKQSVSIRQVKHTLRNAILKYKRIRSTDFNPRLEICIAVEFSKHMKVDAGGILYSSNRNHYDHQPLFIWASEKSMILTTTDDRDKFIQPYNYFMVRDDKFSGIVYQDVATASFSGNQRIHNRTYQISTEYFRDL